MLHHISQEQEQALLEVIRALPPGRVQQVIDFVNFLVQQEERDLVRAGARLSEAALEKVWDNLDDAAYDSL